MAWEFSDYIAAGVELMARRDRDTWALGDLAAEFEVTVGRPADGDDAPTLADLAAGWNVSTQRVSEWRNVSAFYPSGVRTFALPWEIYNAARRAAAGSLDNALELLDVAERQAFTVAAFRRYLSGIRWEGLLTRADLPPQVCALLPGHEARWWVTVKPASEGE